MTPRVVLVTGGAGFIGSHVAERFAREGCEVRVLDDLSSGSRANLDPAWTLHHACITDARASAAALAGCDLVVHLAAFTSVPESFERHTVCYRSNVHGTSLGEVQGALNIGSGQRSELLEVARCVQKLTGAGPRQRFEAARAGDLRSSTADVERARELLGWSARVSLSHGLAQTLAWQQRPRGATAG